MEVKPKNTVSVPRWKPKFKRGKPFAMLIFASRNSGKSYLMRHLIRDYLKDQYDLFVIVSDSPDTKLDFEPVMPKGTIYLTDMNYGIINELERTNKKRVEAKKDPLQMLILFDDKVGNDTKNDQQLLQLFTRGRHLGVSLMFASQAKKLAETTWLNNADYTIILKQNSAQQKRTVIDNILCGTVEIHDEKQEKAILRQIVANYASEQGDALVIDNAARSNDNLHWYRAP